MTPCATLLATLLCLAPSVPEATPAATRIRSVTVYGSGAVVKRAGELPGAGRYVLAGLPRGLDPESVRVRLRGGEVVSVEVRERLRASASDARIAEQQARLEGARRELQALEDQRDTASNLQQLLLSMSQYERDAAREDLADGRAASERWESAFAFLGEHLGQTRTRLRELGWQLEAKQREVADLELELGRLRGAGGEPVRDIELDVLARQQGALALELDYFVGGAGWRPSYDLRAAADLTRVELVYRAQVWQRTGEDWDAVELALSTARPQLGAQGPEPLLAWLDLRDPRQAEGGRGRALKSMGYAAESLAPSDEPELKDAEMPAAPAFAAIEAQGLSVRFVLPRPESVESRDEPTNVLVGRAELALVPERSCVPALDTTVWVRGLAKNTSEWTLLPGRASVFLGDDFLGSSQIETVQPGQDLTLHLGADPGIGVERTLVQDQKKEPGFLSSRVSLVERWRVRLENHGTAGAAADGSVAVIVREAVPRSKDDRIAIEITRAEPKESDDPRWKQEREELGIHTWVLRVPQGGAAELVLETTIQHPKDLELVRRTQPIPLR